MVTTRPTRSVAPNTILTYLPYDNRDDPLLEIHTLSHGTYGLPQNLDTISTTTR